MTPNPHPDDDVLWAVALGRPDAPQDAVEHVGTCWGCARDVRLVRMLAASRYEPMPCPEVSMLVLEAEGRLTNGLALKVREHLGNCVPCTLLVEALDRAEELPPGGGMKEPAVTPPGTDSAGTPAREDECTC